MICAIRDVGGIRDFSFLFFFLRESRFNDGGFNDGGFNDFLVKLLLLLRK